MGVRTYRDLVAWQKAMDFVVGVYGVTRGFPQHELYGLTSQLRKAAVSVPSNIAEGQGRGIGAEFAHHLRIGQDSAQEAETQLLLAERLQYIRGSDIAPVLALADEVGRLIRGLQRAVTSTKPLTTRN